VLDRAELPVDTAQLAHYLIGKMLVRVLAEGIAESAALPRMISTSFITGTGFIRSVAAPYSGRVSLC
jgi:hypothetical protein